MKLFILKYGYWLFVILLAAVLLLALMKPASAGEGNPGTIDEWTAQHGFAAFTPPDATEKDIPENVPSTWTREPVLLSEYLAHQRRK